MTNTRATRLSVILAREAPVAVILRRGPSREVLLLRWNTATDVIEEGQWLRGRIYENRCDLSPNGERFVYFAARWKGEPATWTAVSRPPWLTAALFWPKGDAWGGGGLFETSKRLALNHPEKQRELDGRRAVPRGLKVVPLWQHAGAGEDNPIWHMRLVRDGWTLTEPGVPAEQLREARVWFEYDPPITYRKRAPRDRGVAVEMRITALYEKNGPWYVMEHVLFAGDSQASLGRTSFADFDHGGHLVLARAGVLLRLPRSAMRTLDLDQANVIVDLTDRKFVARKSPARAAEWR